MSEKTTNKKTHSKKKADRLGEAGPAAGKLYIISAPSGTGKTTVIKKVMEMKEDIFFSVSVTTRSMRPGEENGVNYHFITDEEYDRLVAEDALLEHAEFAGNRYGTPAGPIIEHTSRGETALLDIDVQGYRQVKEKMPEAVGIFIVPPSLEELERRLRGRGTDTEEKIQQRLKIAETELKTVSEYDHVVVNDIVERAAAEILEIINK